MYEGSSVGFITVRTTLPPRLLCLYEDRDIECRIAVRITLLTDRNEVRCRGGDEIIQIVFPVTEYFDRDGACSYSIITETWSSLLQIPVQGTIDQLKDKNQKRIVRLTAVTIASGIEFGPPVSGEVEVRLYCTSNPFFHMHCFEYYLRWIALI